MTNTFEVTEAAPLDSSALTRLPRVPLELKRAVEALVALNYEADRLGGSAASALPHPALTFTDRGTTSSLAFTRTCLPFLTTTGTRPSVRMLVPAAQVAGASWRWASDSIEEEDETALLAYLTDEARADRLDPDHAGYIAWPALGLVVAVEGKNRVALLESRRVGWIQPASIPRIAWPSDPE